MKLRMWQGNCIALKCYEMVYLTYAAALKNVKW